MQATVRMALVNQFKDRLEEGSVVTLERYNFGEIQPKYHRVNKALRLSFLSNTKVKPCTDFNGSLYGFDFRRYKSITDLQQEEDGQFDVIGHVVAGEDLNNYDKNEKCGKKKPLTLVDDEEDVEKSKNTTSRISTASKNSTKESFVTKIPLRNIAELLDVGQGEQNDQFSTEITALIVFTVLRLSNDPEILDYIRVSATPSKMDYEATSSALPTITPLDLESQTDENTTPVNTKKTMLWMMWTKKSLRMGRINVVLKMTLAMSLQRRKRL
ncbi:hypothetical protein Tco_0051757 [Tanacetum coccineum]